MLMRTDPRVRAAAAALALVWASPGTVNAAGPQSAYREDGLEMYRKIVGAKTEAGAGQVPAIAAYLADRFRAGGFAPADIHVLPLGETASLIVRYRGDGTGGKAILSMAHLDVVAARREDWKRDPYTLTEENGFFYGRGTYDIKVGVVAITSAFLRLNFMPSPFARSVAPIPPPPIHSSY